MSVCVYDNPATMSRECWQDGRLLCSYPANVMHQKGVWPPPGRLFFFGANIGEWKAGQLLGDEEAMEK